MPDSGVKNGFIGSVRDAIIMILVLAVGGLGGFIINKAGCDARQDAELLSLAKQIERTDNNFGAIYKEIITIGNDISVLKTNQKQILDRVNK